ncbi:MAG: T9SS type A sorting domain-containing protein, partial [Candidatus Eisenbacteria bacterium]|nr:T9SS type A sorting domain-containing protein [Candidatus Eisenbacteria bacterium]
LNFVSTLRGNGTAGVPNGTFAAQTDFNTVSQSRGVLPYDFNGDGITDLAVTGSSVRLLFGNGTGGKGDGTFTLSPTSYTVGSTPNHIATGDFNLDGIADLAVCNTGTTTVSVLLGNGASGVPNGTFQTAINAAAGTGPNAVNVADWDHDGRPDLAIASSNAANSTSILVGLGNGQFEAAQTFATGGSSPAYLAVNDFNEDGTPDLFACNRSSQSFTRQLAGCAATLSSALTLVSPNGGQVWNGGDEQTISWTKAAGIMTVDLQRSDDGGVNWRTIARGLTGTSYAFTAAGPFTEHVRFRVVDPHASQFADAGDADLTINDPALLDVPGGAPKLALLGAWPNPARQDLAVSFSLPTGDASGTLELIDLAGRRVASADLSGLAAGPHRVALLERQSVTPGVYLVRLTHGGNMKSMKVAVLH